MVKPDTDTMQHYQINHFISITMAHNEPDGICKYLVHHILAPLSRILRQYLVSFSFRCSIWTILVSTYRSCMTAWRFGWFFSEYWEWYILSKYVQGFPPRNMLATGEEAMKSTCFDIDSFMLICDMTCIFQYLIFTKPLRILTHFILNILHV